MTMRADRRLDAAVSLGIITEAQAAEIRGIAPDPDGGGASHGEAPRAFNAASLACVLGAITVVIAMGWFLADRWNWLGASGVLAVSVLYATLFLLTAHRLRAQGFRNAAGFTVLLAVCMAPVAAVAWGELTGWFTAVSNVSCGFPDFRLWPCRGEEIFAELVTSAAALIALRSVRFSLLVLPVAAITLRLLFHAADVLLHNGMSRATGGWMFVLGASLLVAAAYATDRRQRGDEDFALWLHLAALICAVTATVQLLNEFKELRHLLIPGAFVASDVFKDSPFFPIILAALGLGVIVATVWVQRNAGRLVSRFGSVTTDGRARFPGGAPLLLTPAVVALLMMPRSMARDLERRTELEWLSERAQRNAELENARAVPDSSALRPLRKETRPPLPP